MHNSKIFSCNGQLGQKSKMMKCKSQSGTFDFNNFLISPQFLTRFRLQCQKSEKFVPKGSWA